MVKSLDPEGTKQVQVLAGSDCIVFLGNTINWYSVSLGFNIIVTSDLLKKRRKMLRTNLR